MTSEQAGYVLQGASTSDPAAAAAIAAARKGDKVFRLWGRRGPWFRVVQEFDAAGFIPSVVGHTLDGKRETVARVADVLFIPDDLPAA